MRKIITIILMVLFSTRLMAQGITWGKDVHNFKLTSGGQIYTAQDVAKTYDNYNFYSNYIRDRENSFDNQSYISFHDDEKTVYVAIVDPITKVFNIGNVDVGKMKKMMAEPGSFMETLHRMRAVDKGFALMVSEKGELYGGVSYENLLGDLGSERVPLFHEFSQSYAREVQSVRDGTAKKTVNDSKRSSHISGSIAGRMGSQKKQEKITHSSKSTLMEFDFKYQYAGDLIYKDKYINIHNLFSPFRKGGPSSEVCQPYGKHHVMQISVILDASPATKITKDWLWNEFRTFLTNTIVKDYCPDAKRIDAYFFFKGIDIQRPYGSSGPKPFIVSKAPKIKIHFDKNVTSGYGYSTVINGHKHTNLNLATSLSGSSVVSAIFYINQTDEELTKTRKLFVANGFSLAKPGVIDREYFTKSLQKYDGSMVSFWGADGSYNGHLENRIQNWKRDDQIMKREREKVQDVFKYLSALGKLHDHAKESSCKYYHLRSTVKPLHCQ